MSSDSNPPRPPREAPRPPRWNFSRVEAVLFELPRPIIVPRGAEAREASYVVEVRLQGELDPGDMEFFDSYLPQIRISGSPSSAMSEQDGEYRFTFYPEVDGELRPGPVEFRARLGAPFEPTGLETGEVPTREAEGGQATVT
jgi:hypothetical protein